MVTVEIILQKVDGRPAAQAVELRPCTAVEADMIC